jgi:hypothetical protein
VRGLDELPSCEAVDDITGNGKGVDKPDPHLAYSKDSIEKGEIVTMTALVPR